MLNGRPHVHFAAAPETGRSDVKHVIVVGQPNSLGTGN